MNAEQCLAAANENTLVDDLRREKASGFMISFKFPFTESKIRSLKIGDEIFISGAVFTGHEHCCQIA
ncbi:MAG: hypothetical protein DME21_00100 [Verrucomicrobia bacterium]|nr:MAG: hypothetical protein DME21_00100 [Verrucomicrobiota bacterium]